MGENALKSKFFYDFIEIAQFDKAVSMAVFEVAIFESNGTIFGTLNTILTQLPFYQIKQIR